MKNIHSIRDFKLANQTVFLRLDLNVPLSEASEGEVRSVTDDTRIVEALPVIQHCIKNDARVVIASHLGRPKGKKDSTFSLEPVALHLAKLLSTEVILAEDYLSEGFELMVQNMKGGEVMLLENLRFHGQEEANEISFCQSLARFTDLYVNDAFGTAHRKHASTFGLPSLIENKAIGFLIEKEIKFLEPLLKNPPKPFHVILGGAKVSDKIKTINRLMKSVDAIFIGGAMAHAFTKANGGSLLDNAKKPTPEDIDAARSILRDAQKRELPIHLPIDMVESYDIGPKTIELFSSELAKAKTVFWNGPLGWFENEKYKKGTQAVAETLSTQSATKVIGGGDTVAAIKQFNLAEKFDHLSTGGGAVLKYLEGNGLVGIDVLTFNPNRATSPVLSTEE